MKPKLDVGGTLNQVFDIYREQAGVLLPVAFILFLIVAVVEVLLDASLALLPLVLVVSTVAATLYQGMVVNLVRDVQDGRRDSSVGELMNSVLPVLLPLIGAGLLAGLGIGLGFFLLVIPGLFLATIWAVIAPAIVVEGRGVFESFGRSRELVKDNGWPVFGTIVVAFLITFITAAIFGAIAIAIADDTVAVAVVFSVIAKVLTAPIGALVAGVLYFRLLAIKGEQPSAEGLAAAPHPTAPPSYEPPPPPTPGT